MSATLIATASVFTTGHIAVTAAISGLIAAIVAVLWLHGERRTVDALAIGLLTGGAVILFRKSANMPQLNSDGLQGFSANDLLAPTVVFVVLGLYAAFRQTNDPRRLAQACAAATVVAFVVNLVTI
jgi:hypothetical protein